MVDDFGQPKKAKRTAGEIIVAGHKASFLAAYRQCGNISSAAEAANVARSMFYYWCEHDDAFVAAAQQARLEAVDRLIAEARRRAMEGVRQETPIFYLGRQIGTTIKTEYSDNLLMFLIKQADPSFRDRVDLHHSGGISDQSADPGEDHLTADQRSALRDFILSPHFPKD